MSLDLRNSKFNLTVEEKNGRNYLHAFLSDDDGDQEFWYELGNSVEDGLEKVCKEFNVYETFYSCLEVCDFDDKYNFLRCCLYYYELVVKLNETLASLQENGLSVKNYEKQ